MVLHQRGTSLRRRSVSAVHPRRPLATIGPHGGTRDMVLGMMGGAGSMTDAGTIGRVASTSGSSSAADARSNYGREQHVASAAGSLTIDEAKELAQLTILAAAATVASCGGKRL